MTLQNRDFLTLKDFTPDEITYLLDLAAKLKTDKKAGITHDTLKGKNVALIFEKPSTRTRCSFTVACADEGGYSEYLGKNEIQLGYKESMEDTARVLARMFDGIEFRGYSHEKVETLANYSEVPVWNGLTDEYHPTQILADFLTIRERFGRLAGLKMVFAGDGRNNMANSLMIGCAKMGLHFVIAAPESLQPEETLRAQCQAMASANGGSLTLTADLASACQDADVLYTDVWCSMGEEDKMAERVQQLAPYQINADIMEQAKDTAIFLHCLPAVKGNEVTKDVFEGPQSVVFDEAENRMHTIKAVMVATIGNLDKLELEA